MVELAEAMRAADEITDLDAYEFAVKTAVKSAVRELDPSASIEDTRYFNHSAVPDFVLSWGRKQTRPLFIRRSFEEVEAGNDVDHFSESEPVILAASASDEGGGEARATLRRKINATNGRGKGTLVASAGALDSLSPIDERTANPMSSLLSGQVLPSARGVLDEARARTFADPEPEVVEQLLVENFPEESLYGLRAAVDLVTAALSPDIIVPLEGDSVPLAQLRQILPWLLTNADVRQDEFFWASLARRVDLPALQASSSVLEGLDLTRLCTPGSEVWSASRAARSAQASWAIAEDGSPVVGWFIREGLLTHQAGDEAFWFRTSGRGLQDRETESSATWDRIAPRLNGYQLLEVGLRGIARGIVLNANASPDVAADAASIVDSLTDNYFVDHVLVSRGLREEERVMKVEIGRYLAINEGKATVADLEHALRRFVNYNSPLADVN